MASTYLTKTFSSDTTAGRRKWTWSAWVKRSALGTESWLFHAYQDGNNENSIFFDTSDRIAFSIYEGASNSNGRLTTTRKFRDTSAWYHIVVVWDSANSTAADRMIIYVNGERLTAYDTNTNGGSNHQTLINKSGVEHSIGRYGSGTYYFNGLMAHVHFTDGYAYAASDFGSTDATTGEWKINTSPSVTYGTNGFFILKDGNSVTDQSGNSNNWTVAGGTLTNTEDNPSNIFCTFNGINPYSGTLSNGNLKMSQTNFHYNVQGTLGMESGKYYWEYKLGSTHGEFGICEQGKAGQTDPQGSIGFYMIYSNGSGGVVVYNNATSSSSTTNSGWTNFASGQIIGIAYDADNGKLYFHNNGTYYNSGDPAAGTGAVITGISPQYGGIMVPFCGHGSSSITANTEANFGNGYFGTTAISSEGTNASGIGKFEYDVPTGFTALSTKGLNE